jgi:hypothetical protein
MINTKNVIEFIKHLYFNKYQNPAPQALLDKWSKLTDTEIQGNLQALFASWNYSTDQAEQIKKEWFYLQKSKESKVTNTANVQVLKSTSKWWRWPILILIFGTMAYGGTKYLQFSSLKKVYAITDNISVRDETGESIYRMDLIPQNNSSQPSSSSMTTADEVVYEKTLDSSGKMRQYRKVLYPEITFKDYLLNNATYAFVNANLVTSNAKEYEKYKNVFKGLSQTEGKTLELKYRKVMVGCLELLPEAQGLYAMSSCLNSKAGKGFSNFVTMELQKDAMYEVVARMSDGYYYKFTGNLRANSFVKPRKIGFAASLQSDDDYMKGDFLFKYYAKDKSVKLFKCDGKPAYYNSVTDSYGGIDYFNYSPPTIDTPTNGDDVIDAIKDAGGDVINGVVDGIKDLINN